MSDFNQQPKMGHFKRSVELTKSAWHVLKLDKELMTLPLIGFLYSIVVLVISGAVLGASSLVSGNGQSIIRAVAAVVAAVGLTFVSSLIAGAICYAAIHRFEGGDPTVKGSLAAARQKAKPLFLFSVLTATIGLVLRVIEERIPVGGVIMSWLGSVAWSIASLFAIPFIVTSNEHLGPIEATKKSTSLIKQVWGESVLVSLGIGLIGILVTFGYLIIATLVTTLFGLGIGVSAGVVVGILAILGFVALMIGLSVLGAIAKTAIFYWATTGKAPETFNQELLRTALTPKKARKIFA